ncbi:SigE family RNA polymerase sigma factor [Plantactinospora sp. GCM10030261]|uniref:SigE family RNA polymerase sigma factor n=1 Tax=Plantactinospora sp. GCM10030261 TaxID=3273420 RepID=UPI003605D5B2
MPEPEGFDEFVRGCSHRLFRVGCLLTGGDLARAEDLVAEALARVYLAWPRVRAGDAFGYARRTLVNLHTDWWRGLRRRAELVTDRVPELSNAADHAGAVAQRDSVTRSLLRLTRRERAVVVLRYFLDLTEQDTANELGVSVGTVKSTNARALAKLRVSPEFVGSPVRRHRQPPAVAVQRQETP